MKNRTNNKAKAVIFTALLGISGFTITPLLAHPNPQLAEAIKNSSKEQVSFFRQMKLSTQLANHYKMIGKKEKEKYFFEESHLLMEKITQNYLKVEAKAHLANELASAKKYDASLEILAKIEDQRVRAHTTWKVAGKLAKDKKHKESLELLLALQKEIELIKELELKAELLTGTGAKHRYIDPKRGVPLVYEAYGIIQTYKDPFTKAIMYNELGANLIDIGENEKAMQLFKESKEIGMSIKDPHKRAEVFAMHGGELAEKGKREEAKISLAIALDAALQLKNSLDKDDLLSEIAKNFGQSYAFEEALKVSEMIQDPYHQAEAYVRISKNMYKQKESKNSISLLEKTYALTSKIENNYEKATILRKLASEWHMSKNSSKVEKLLLEIEKILSKV